MAIIRAERRACLALTAPAVLAARGARSDDRPALRFGLTPVFLDSDLELLLDFEAYLNRAAMRAERSEVRPLEPTVTLVFVLRGELPRREATPYTLAQFFEGAPAHVGCIGPYVIRFAVWRFPGARLSSPWRKPRAFLAVRARAGGPRGAFAAGRGTLSAMTDDSRRTSHILDAVGRPSTRSPLFWWMVEHHDRILARAVGGRLAWGELCALFAGAGLLDATGKPASARTARETWRQARLAVRRGAEWEAARAAERAKVSIPPARRKPGSVPAYVMPAGTPTAPAPAPRSTVPVPFPAPPTPLAEGEEEDTPEERARIEAAKAGVRAQFRKSDEKFRLG